ncbi:MAG: right-handed parallel beta-helix repeat-containing protein [Planctomycetales bacterium]|nr:right-handed parallel beta-helix repeat-containing protein [Planctomycetales bacterium]
MFQSKTLPAVAHLLLAVQLSSLSLGDETQSRDYSPSPDERQLPLAMHSQMDERPRIRVGVTSGDLTGSDNRVLQAAVEYVAALGGGTVEIGPGEYLMHDSLHLRPSVHVVGSGQATVLKKAPGTVVNLGIDGDFGEQQVTIEDGVVFGVGQGIAIWDAAAGGFHTTVARITGKTGNTYSIDKPLMADCLISRNAKAGTLYPVISGYDLVNSSIRNLTVDGTKETNAHLNGCRGGGIFLYRGFGTRIEDCWVKNFNGDGISFQQSNDVVVQNCIVEGNTELGLHPGSGSQRPTVVNCVARDNGTDGLFLCWRVRHGKFEGNTLERNGRFGISIGHKDTDNILLKNIVRQNASNGIFFRDESLGMAAHRNEIIENTIEDNGAEPGTAAIRIRGETKDLVFKNNTIRDTRSLDAQTQTVGILIEQSVHHVALESNEIKAEKPLQDERNHN